MPGIKEENISVNLERDAFTVDYDPVLVTLDAMYEAIRQLGYSPGLQAPEKPGTSLVESPEASPIDASLSDAMRTNKLVLVDFSADWCAACKLLETQVLSDASVIEALQNYVFVEIDTDRYSDSAKTYDVVGMPTLVILSSEGDELYRNVGLIAPDEFARILSELAGDE